MKKIISSILAVMLMISCLSITSFAAVTTETPALLTGTLDPVTSDMAGYDKYSLKFYIENAPLNVTAAAGFGGTYTYTGETMSGMDLDISVSATADGVAATKNVDYAIVSNTTITAKFMDTPAGFGLSAADTAPLLPVVGKSFSTGDSVLIGEVYVYASTSKVVCIDIDWTDLYGITIGKYNASSTPTADQPVEYKKSNGLLVLKDSTKNGFTIGEADEPEVVDGEWMSPVVGTEYQNCGFKATLAYDNTKTGVLFKVNSTVLNKSGEKKIPFGSLTIENAENITVGLNITEVDLAETSTTMTATAELY